MYYREALRVRKGLFIYLIVLGALVVLQIISNLYQFGGPIIVNPNVPKHVEIPLSLPLVVSGIATMIFGAILGMGLSIENSGHLELAWTKPTTRGKYALGMIAVDVIGMAIFFVLTLVVLLVMVLGLDGLASHFVIDPEAWHNLLRYLAVPLAWYALILALTASLRQLGGLAVGLAWIGAVVLLALGTANFPHPWSDIVGFLLYFNPLAYAAIEFGDSSVAVSQPTFPFPTWYFNVTGLIVLCILFVIAALTQWRRLEA